MGDTPYDLSAIKDAAANPSSVDNIVAGLQKEVAAKVPAPAQGDPINTAFHSIQAGANTFNFLQKSFGAITGHRIVASLNEDGGKDPSGLSVLDSSYQSQKTSDFSLDANTFSQRVKLAGILPPGQLQSLNEFRAKLDAPDKALFDDAYFGDLQTSVDDYVHKAIDKAHGGNGQFLRAGPAPTYTQDGKAHFYTSPRAEDLMRQYSEKVGIPFTNQPTDILSYADEWKARAQSEPELYQELVSEGLRPQLQAYNAGAMKQDGYTQAIGALADFGSPKIAELVTAPLFATDAAGITPDKHDEIRNGVDQVANQIIRGALDPKGLVAILSGFAIPAPAAATVLERIAFHAFTGGLVNMGLDSEAAQEHDVQRLAIDFASGAIGGTVPEILGSVARTRSLNPKAIAADLRTTRIGQPELTIDEEGAVYSRLGEKLSGPGETPNLPGSILNPDLISPAELTQLRKAHMAASNQAFQEHQRFRALQRRAANPANNIGPEQLDAGRNRFIDAVVAAKEAQRELRNAAVAAELRAHGGRIQNVGNQIITDPGAQNAFETAQVMMNQAASQAKMAARYTDPAMSPNFFRRTTAMAAAMISGRMPGQLAWIADARNRIAATLLEHDRPVMANLIPKGANDLAESVGQSARYVGPDKGRLEFLKTPLERVRDIVEHPEHWADVNPRFTAMVRQIESFMDQKFSLLEMMGYPTKRLRENYLQHFWENDLGDIRQAYQGTRSITKTREFDDYVTGVKAGLTAKPFTFAELWARHNQALNETLSDAWFRKTLIEQGHAVKGGLGPLSGRTPYKSGLFAGYSGPRSLVEPVDAFMTRNGSVMRNLNTASQRFKNSAFGSFDVGVFGQQLLHGGLFGNIPAITSLVNDGLRLAHLPHVQAENLYAQNYGKSAYWASQGLRLGAKAADIETQQGSILGYVPGFKGLDNLVERGWTDRLAEFQFNTVLTPVRIRIAEGNMIMEHLLNKLSLGKLGRGLTDPETSLASARLANALTLTSEGAQRSTRRGIESIAATSANAVRGELNTIGQLSKLVLTNPLTNPEWHMAAMTLASFAVSLYTIKVAAEALGGVASDPFNPFNGDWGTVNVGGKRIGLVKERSIINAVSKSWKAVQQAEPGDLAAAWTQYGVGKSSPLISGAEGLAGYGFDSSGRFTSNLSWNERLLNLPPVAPILEKLYTSPATRTDPFALSLESIGLSESDIGVTQQRDDYLVTHNPYGIDDPRHKDVEKFGYSGLEDSEQLKFANEHPEFFSGKASTPEMQKVLETITTKRNKLAQLEEQVKQDPYLRTNYKDLRAGIESDAAKVFAALPDTQPKTLQDQAKKVYFDTIDEARKAADLEVLTGDAYGEAVDEARKRVLAKYGDEGVQALDRSLLSGSTQLEQEYRADQRKIQDSGYYNLADEGIKFFRDAGELPFDKYSDFQNEINTYAKEQGVVPGQVAAKKKVDAKIAAAKEKWRELHPEIDALLVKWGSASAPRSEEARRLAAQALGRPGLEIAAGAKPKKKSTSGTQQMVDRLMAPYINP